MEITFYHYASGGSTLSTDALTFKWYVLDGSNWRLMWNKSGTSAGSGSLRFQDEVEGGTRLNPTTHRFYTSSTSTDEVNVSMRVEVLKW